MTKVAFFAEILIDDFDGASRTMFHIIRRIDKTRFSYKFYCGVPPKENFEHDVITIPTVTTPFNKNYKMAIPQLKSGKLVESLKEFGPDVIHIATPSLLGEWALKYALDHKIPVISIYHTHFISYFQFYLHKLPWLVKPIESIVRKRMVKFYNKCNLTYVPSNAMIDELVSYGVQKDRLIYWPRGLDHDIFNSGCKDSNFRQSIKLDQKNTKPLILYASRLVWEKNVQTLIELYQISNHKYHFVIAGDGVAMEAMQKAMPNATFMGSLDHFKLARVYASCDVFVFPSITETYGNVVVEAMASGLPCVIANGGGSASFIRHGVNGFLVDPLNAKDYDKHIDEIFDKDELREKFIKEGLQFTAHLDWKRLTDTYFNEIENLKTTQC